MNTTIGFSLISTSAELFDDMLLLLLTKSWLPFSSPRFMLKDGSSSHQLCACICILVMLCIQKVCDGLSVCLRCGLESLAISFIRSADQIGKTRHFHV